MATFSPSVLLLQSNSDRNPVEEMLAAEESGAFMFIPPSEDDEMQDAQEELEPVKKVRTSWITLAILTLILAHTL